MRRYPWLPIAAIILAIVILLISLLLGGLFLGIGIAIAVALAYAFILFNRWKKAIAAVDDIKPENQKPEVVDHFVKSADFRLVPFGSSFRPALGGTTDSPMLSASKTALKDAFEVVNVSRESIVQPQPLKSIDVRNVTDHVVTKLDPAVTIPAMDVAKHSNSANGYLLNSRKSFSLKPWLSPI